MSEAALLWVLTTRESEALLHDWKVPKRWRQHRSAVVLTHRWWHSRELLEVRDPELRGCASYGGAQRDTAEQLQDQRRNQPGVAAADQTEARVRPAK
jgi:hypothetical protein